jgi:hypothetical protein
MVTTTGRTSCAPRIATPITKRKAHTPGTSEADCPVNNLGHRDSEVNSPVVRPLLRATRADVLRYLEELGQKYRRDRTNDNLDLTRIRQEFLRIPRKN